MSQTYANSINSNPIYADRAEKDAAGNTISTTYATKQEIPTIPTIVGLTAGANVTITEANNTVTIAATDTTYSAGNMISIDSNNSNAIGVLTTAGITDIQQVSALPASPVATVLYLIPES